MTLLYKRTASLVVDTVGIDLLADDPQSSLDFSFKAKKHLKPEPNTLDLRLYNLAPETRNKLESQARVTCRLEVGYGGDNQQIFLGEVRSCRTTVEGATRVTTFQSGDSEKEIQQARCHVTYGAQVQVDVALKNIIDTIGVGQGNLQQAVARLKARGITNLFPRGGVFYGNAWRILQGFAHSANLEISIQDGALLILDRGKAMDGKAVLLASGAGPQYPGLNTGLIESPTTDADGTVNCSALIVPGLIPGNQVIIDSIGVQGLFRVYDIEYNGATRGQDWKMDLTLQKLKTS